MENLIMDNVIIYLIRSLLVFMLAINNFNNSSKSLRSESYIFFVRNSVANNKSSQYLLSFASFKAILNLKVKSFMLSACSASLIIAPIAVALLIKCVLTK
jgi:hypothetical protein